MQVVIKTLRNIHLHALPHRWFKEFLKKLYSEYGDVVYLSHVWWLNRGRCLQKLCELHQQIVLFINDKQVPVPELSNYE